MSNEIIKIEGQTGITATGWNLTGINENQWKDAGKVLVQVDQARQWWLGDWWNACPKGDGKKTCQNLGINPGTAKNAGSVCQSFATSRRRDFLTFSHHVEVTKINIFDEVNGEKIVSSEKTKEMQDKFLDLAEEESWTVSFTRQKVQNYMAMSDWSESEKERRFDVEKGLTVVANINKDGDTNLVNWAKQQGVYVFVGRSQFDLGWGNPFGEEDGGREIACDAHVRYFKDKISLHDKIEKLKGKVLGCYCYPERCHGDYLADLANEVTTI